MLKKDIPVIYLSFSSGMSGSYYSALQAVEVLKRRLSQRQSGCCGYIGC